MKNIEFINAGAGSGKTYTLVKILADYISGETASYKPHEIILTTFTENAASEIREKARTALIENGLFDEAAQLESASIGTVHSIAFNFVRKYWYLSGRGVNDQVMSENDKQFYINQSLASIATEEQIQFFDTLMDEFGFSSFDGESNTPDPDYWKKDLKNIIGKMEQYEIEDLSGSREQSKLIIDSFFNKKSSFNKEYAKNILKTYLNICGSKSRKEKAEKFINSLTIKYSDINNIVTLEPVEKERKQLTTLDEILAEAAFELRDKKYGDKLKSYIDIVFDLASQWKVGFNDYKAKNHLIDYNDMERLFLELLNNKAFTGEIKEKVKLVFVDEFQDSSPMQVKIFDRLSELAEKSIWVGDPKQAIYGFRGSDSLLIKAISDRFEKGDNGNQLKKGKTLNVSYRSRKGLVDLSNAIFTSVFKDICDENIRLESKRSDHDEFNDNSPKETIHWHLCISNSRASNVDHYQNLAQKVHRLLSSETKVFDKITKSLRTIRPDDVAILCRNNRTVHDIAASLTECGIKTTVDSSDASFTENAEIKLFMAIANYILNDRNDLAKAEIIYLTNFEQYPVSGLIRSRLNYVREKEEKQREKEEAENPESVIFPIWEDKNPFIRKIDLYAKHARILPVPDLVEYVITLFDLKTIVSEWKNGEQRVNHLEKLISYAKAYDERCLQMGLGASLNNFIVYLNALEDQNEKAEKLKGKVNVLTYHKSKGLEWNVVILENLDIDELNQNDVIRKSFFGVNDILTELPSPENLYPERKIQLLPWFPGAKKTVPADIHELIIENPGFKNTEVKIREEIKRLMYVGITRARDYIITTSYHNANLRWIKNIGCTEIIPETCTTETIDLWGTPFVSDYLRCVKDPDFEVSSGNHTTEILVKPEEAVDFPSRYISPSTLHDSSKAGVEIIANFNQRIAVNATKNSAGESLSDAEIGTCLHDFFCVYKQTSDQNLHSLTRILENRMMQSVFPEPERIVCSIDKLYNFLNETYGPAIRIYKELPLQQYTDNGQIIRGSCDLVWETEKGCILIDYKSFQGKKDQITAPDDKFFAGKYSSQIKNYTNIIEGKGKKVITSLIYYAVIGIVIEIHPV